jgi:SNF family Na+-dependent transporter
MPGNRMMFFPTLTSVAFFFLMCVAAITSTISLMEVMVSFFCEASASTKPPSTDIIALC